MMYCQDYDEKFPGASAIAAGVPRVVTGSEGSVYNSLVWPDLIYPYVQNKQMFKCPSRPNEWLPYGWNIRMGYSIGGASSGPMYEGVAMASVKYVAETLIIADSDWTGASDYGWSNSYMLDYTPHVSRFIPARHNDGANIVFADGHAKWYHVPLDPNYTGTGSPPLTLNPAGILWSPDGTF